MQISSIITSQQINYKSINMKKNRGSLITQSQTLKLPKIAQSMVYKQNDSNLPCRRDKFFIRPQMKKILYSPFQDKKKAQKNHLIVQSCITNRNYNDLNEQHIQNKVQTSLIESDVIIDKVSALTSKNRTLVGKQAPFTYYGQYKKLAKLIAKAHCNKQNYNQSPYLAMLQKTQKFDILPLCMGLVKFQGDQSTINLNNYNLGDKYIIAMAAGLKNAKLIQKCFFSNNRISNKGMHQLTKSLHHDINVLDVSHNNISKLQNNLMQLIINTQAHLQKLNLQRNQIRSQQIIQTLINNVMYSKHLRVLNLRGNGIGINCSNVIAELLDKQTQLEQLYIGSNFITATGGYKIFQNLTKNKNIKIFDYSLNHLGQDQNYICAKSIANCLSKNKTLHHMDLSNNSFNEQASRIIAQGLEPNRKLYGFHYNGNFGYVDSRGFLIVQQKQITSLHSLIETNINSYQICYKRQNITIDPQMYKNVCWICQGWYQQQFKFIIPQDYKQQKKLVYLHFDFQLYTPRLINLTDKNVKYITMVPPKKYKYFFTFNNQQFIDKNAKTYKLEFPQTFTYQMYHIPTTFIVQEVCQRKGKPKKMVNDWNEVIISTLPRNTGLVSKKQKQVWTYDKSIWAKQWKLDNQDILKKCFQRDWKCSKLMNLVKNQNDQDKLRQKLYQNYKAIKLAYKYFSSWSPFSDIWAVSNNSWTQFCQQSKIISKDTPLKITDLTFITTNSMSGADWKGNQLVPQRGLVRFQFMQALVRLSQQKFKKNGLTQTFTDSISLLLKDHVLPLSISIIQQKWRYQKYFAEENDILVKKYRPIFIHIYKKNSKLKVKPGQKPFMCLTQFKGIMQKANIAGSLIIQRDIYLSFNFSMMTQIDQLENQRFLKMTQIQFIQAVARCAQVLPKTCTLSKTPQSKFYLHNKFEWLINQIKNTQCSEQIKNQYTQEGSLFDQLQTDQ